MSKYELGKSKQSSYAKKKRRFIVRAEIRANAETNCCCSLAPRRYALRRCPARRIQASEPRLTASGLAAKDVPSALESTCLGILFCDTMRLTAAAVVYEYVTTERCAPSALLSISRSEPVPAD